MLQVIVKGKVRAQRAKAMKFGAIKKRFRVVDSLPGAAAPLEILCARVVLTLERNSQHVAAVPAKRARLHGHSAAQLSSAAPVLHADVCPGTHEQLHHVQTAVYYRQVQRRAAVPAPPQ
jgi:hypothetical protein